MLLPPVSYASGWGGGVQRIVGVRSNQAGSRQRGSKGKRETSSEKNGRIRYPGMRARWPALTAEFGRCRKAGDFAIGASSAPWPPAPTQAYASRWGCEGRIAENGYVISVGRRMVTQRAPMRACFVR